MTQPIWIALCVSLLLAPAACGPSASVDGSGNRPDARAGDNPNGPAQPDADGDGISDEQEGRATNRDTDGDGTPDYQDIDSDGDNVADADERTVDVDADGIPAYLDSDSDGDCVPDAAEAGDFDLATQAVDTDTDNRPNIFDLDSDNDGLTDGAEDLNCNGIRDRGESAVLDDDTDDDGAPDLVEVTAGTQPDNAADNPQANGDFVFLMPYQAPPTPSQDDLDFSTNLRIMDVYVLADRSGSMTDELTSIRDNIQRVANELTCPAQGPYDPSTCIQDIWWGVGTIGYSGTGGESYTNHQSMQPNPALVSSKMIITEPTRGGPSETINLAVWSTSSGKGSAAAATSPTQPCNIGTAYPDRPACPATNPNGIGYPCFRPNALPVILLATDEAPSQSYNCPGMTKAIEEANKIGAKIIGVLGAVPDAQTRPDLETYARMTGAVNSNNNNAPLVVDGANSTAADAIKNAIRLLAAGVPLDLAAVPVDVAEGASDRVDTVAAFIDRLETLQLGTPECANGLGQQDSNNDGIVDRYIDVRPGTPVCWRLTPKSNTTVRPTGEPQLYKAQIEVFGDNVTRLDTRQVFFLVPPDIIEPPIE